MGCLGRRSSRRTRMNSCIGTNGLKHSLRPGRQRLKGHVCDPGLIGGILITSDVHRLDDAAGHTRRRVYTFDVSTHGCRIESDTAVGIGKFVSLQLDLESAKGYRAGTIIEAARVRWVKGHTFGLE